ncbi:hypothetical protein ONS95_010748 [Cadophora gregata]|uniref:uncharacterized protein n=1 Tax=Cadophora gregata TaxID=51156 RepID=UPI0026DCD8E8|nr:uncharacterized protein ONS95_010748 [Cadophora gregata]KAK0122520.1 hypothetical protein ONS95_010748 [Cadophora gregata]KAK0127997.1 hypothetical protein ONS96_007490 [Cadophora gregata f. sp. sojae]
MGAMIVGSENFINRVRRIRKRVGGGMRQSVVLSAADWAALDNFNKLPEVHRLARTVADMWIVRGGRLRRRTRTNLVWLDLRDAQEFRRIGIEHGIQLDGCRIVLHHQISRKAILRLGQVFDTVLASSLLGKTK